MATTVKPIEAKAVHLIQSGQVIVDLCSVVKELVENSLDAGATSIEVRFQNNGLEGIEVQDNGSGIAAANFENVALKHYTSKLSTYDDLDTLSTFGFRGEALSSLCALSCFQITTAQEHEAPKGSRLEFEKSGKLKSTSVVACQRGTVTSVTNLFDNLPVRRRELTKNIKREYGKVLGLLHAYACISTSVKFTVKNSMPKAKSVVVFATKSNATTRENIANVYGAKTLSALVPLELELDFEQSTSQHTRNGNSSTKVNLQGHISKPLYGEGRQTPDRQMFFVNGRPCGLPQIAKAINEVYKSFNVSQSPFIFADFQMDTSAYDVNVSPDKRSILLHNAVALIESLKSELTDMFDNLEQTIPQAQLPLKISPALKQPKLSHISSEDSQAGSIFNTMNLQEIQDPTAMISVDSEDQKNETHSLFRDHFQNSASTRENTSDSSERLGTEQGEKERMRRASRIAKAMTESEIRSAGGHVHNDSDRPQTSQSVITPPSPGFSHGSDHDGSQNEDTAVRDFNARMHEPKTSNSTREPAASLSPGMNDDERQHAVVVPRSNSTGVVKMAYDRMRPKRQQPEVATITIGNKVITKVIGGTTNSNRQATHHSNNVDMPKRRQQQTNRSLEQFSQRLGQFSALDSQRIDLERIEHSDRGEPSLAGSAASGDEYDESAGDSNDDHIADETPSTREKRDLVDDNSNRSLSEDDDHDENDEAIAKAQEEKRVADLIQAAESVAARSTDAEKKRIDKALKGGRSRDSTGNLYVTIESSLADIHKQAHKLCNDRLATPGYDKNSYNVDDTPPRTAEEKLSLTVSKSDFAKMSIVGQFNLGFILAVRDSEQQGNANRVVGNTREELFIIDQHAADEKFNFERLQAETTVGNQRMVRPVMLELTAVEEEILMENMEALEMNGFVVETDVSDDCPVGQRCRLVSLPLSKEVVFDTGDLDELIHLLSEMPVSKGSKAVPRPSKVRKMFAMRACRSSIMIGKTLSRRQMSTVVQHMGTIDKPWNCPHGRPTMRHLASLDVFDGSLWCEGDGLTVRGDDGSSASLPSLRTHNGQVWKEYMSQTV